MHLHCLGWLPTCPRTQMANGNHSELVARTEAFFADAEPDVAAERIAAIADILRIIREFGLTPVDLLD